MIQFGKRNRETLLQTHYLRYKVHYVMLKNKNNMLVTPQSDLY